MNPLAVDVLSALPLLVDMLANTVSTPDPTVIPTPSPTSVLVELKTGEKSLLESILASPLLAALGAIGAATLVFKGTEKQVQKLHDGNLETARKNKEDQWWSTLKWAYEQASADSNKTSDVFKERAVLGIFESLAIPGISPEQVAALENIKSVFREKADPSTEAGVENLERAIEASKSGSPPIGPRQTQSSLEYRRQLLYALKSLSPRLGLTRVYAHQQGAPLLFETAAGKLIGLAPLYVAKDDDQESNPRSIARDMRSQAMSREFTVTTEAAGILTQIPARKIDLFAVVTNAQKYWPWSRDTGADAPLIFFPEPSETTPQENLERVNSEREQQSTRPGVPRRFFTERLKSLEDGLTKLIGPGEEDGRPEGAAK